MKRKKVISPVNFNTCATNFGKIVDTGVEEKLLRQNLLLLDAVIRFVKNNGKLTKKKKNEETLTAKEMRYQPLVIKWCCSLASRCQEKGYQRIRNILPLLPTIT